MLIDIRNIRQSWELFTKLGLETLKKSYVEESWAEKTEALRNNNKKLKKNVVITTAPMCRGGVRSESMNLSIKALTFTCLRWQSALLMEELIVSVSLLKSARLALPHSCYRRPDNISLLWQSDFAAAAECEQKLWQHEWAPSLHIQGRWHTHTHTDMQHTHRHTQGDTEEADGKHRASHVSGRPVVMAQAGAVSHDREQRRKSKVEGKREEDGGKNTGVSEERSRGKGEVRECSRGQPGLTIWSGETDLRVRRHGQKMEKEQKEALFPESFAITNRKPHSDVATATFGNGSWSSLRTSADFNVWIPRYKCERSTGRTCFNHRCYFNEASRFNIVSQLPNMRVTQSACSRKSI